MEGTRIGAYRVESELGAGGMGTVWLAEAVMDEAIVPRGTRVAVKVVHPHLLGQPGFFKRFMREAEVGRQVDHENVVRTFDVDALEVDGATAHFLVMEYVEGRTLRAMLHDLGTVPEALLREIARQVAAGLSAIHDAGVVHRDLKPENILVTDDHQVRIMDLGVARLVEESVALTRRGEFAGSLLYAAPEQFQNEEVGPLSDLYSLGVLLYELATGDNPFRRDSAAQVISAHLEDVPRTATEVGAELSDFFGEVLTTLLAKQPEGRFESAASLQEVLKQGERSAWWAEREKELLKTSGHHPRVPVRRETELYGRETELHLLHDAWARACQCQGNTILLEGEAGIGKTRLVDTFLKELEGEEVHVLYGSYPPSGGMGGLSDAITDHFGLQGLEEALRPYLTVTPSLVPAFAALVRHENPPTGSEPIQGDALHAVMVHLMRGLAQEKPLVWVIDDLHFSDPDSRKIVLSLARAVEGNRVMLLTTSRPGLPEDEVANFSRLESFRRADLGRLSPREVIQLLRDAFKSEMLAEKLGGRIAYKSDGVPFFVFEMIRGLREGQMIKEMPDGTWVETQVIEEIDVPSAVKDLIEARLRDLSDDDRNLLDVAAVYGFEFDPDLIARVLERKRISVLQGLAGMERRSGVVRASGRTFRFDHHQIQEVVHGTLAVSLREEYHSLLADAFEDRLEGKPTGEDRVFLASHRLNGTSPETARTHLESALAHLAETHQHGRAIELADRALPATSVTVDRASLLLVKAEHLNAFANRNKERETVEAALDLARECESIDLELRAMLGLGRHLQAIGGHLEASEWFSRAAAGARDAARSEPERSALLGLALTDIARGRPKEAIDHAGRVVELSTEAGDDRSRAESLVRWGQALSKLGREEEGGRRAREGLSLAREIGDLRTQAIALGSAIGTGTTQEGCDRCEEAVAIARQIGDRQLEARALGNLGVYKRDLGRLEEARDHHKKRIALAGEIADPGCGSNAAANLGILAHLAGDTEQSLGWFRQQLLWAERSETSVDRCLARANIAITLMENGRLSDALDEAGVALDLARDVDDVVCVSHAASVLAGVRALLGDLEGAWKALHEAPPESTWGRLFLWKGTLSSWRSEPDRALEYFRAGDENASHWVYRCRARLALAGLFVERQEYEEAARTLDVALPAPPAPVLPEASAIHIALRARLPGIDLAALESQLRDLADRPYAMALMEAHHHFWRATGSDEYLAKAHGTLCEFVDHAPEEYRETMITNVPLHRDIMAAWNARGGSE
jgi:serine/threonine protein kinase/tetratricopeptide (TPR) repeat protein